MRRAFVANGAWRDAVGRGEAEQALDPAQQRKATLRVSALAGAVTLALIAGPDLPLQPSMTEQPRRATVAMPELVAAKRADRVPTASEAAGPLQRRPRVEAPATAAPESRPGIEIVDAATLRAGAMTVRIAGLAIPSADRSCRRLDGLSVSCIDRAESYLELLVRGRAVACDRAGVDAQGVEFGRCRIGDVDLAEQMVRQGWAEAADRDAPKLVMAEAQAKRQKLGIWRE